jgi:hypothetical protein
MGQAGRCLALPSIGVSRVERLLAFAAGLRIQKVLDCSVKGFLMLSRSKTRARRRPETTRITVVFSSEVVKWMEDLAAKNAMSMNDVLRRIVDDARGVRIAETSASQTAGLGARHDR